MAKKLSGGKKLFVTVLAVLLIGAFFAIAWAWIVEFKWIVFSVALVGLIICSFLIKGFKWSKIFSGMFRSMKR